MFEAIAFFIYNILLMFFRELFENTPVTIAPCDL